MSVFDALSHNSDKRQSESEHNRRRPAFGRRRCRGTRQLEVKAGPGAFECERSGGISEARDMRDAGSAESHRARVHVPGCQCKKVKRVGRCTKRKCPYWRVGTNQSSRGAVANEDEIIERGVRSSENTGVAASRR